MAGERDIRFEVDSAGKMVFATVDMGSPELDPVQVPVDLTSNAVAPDGSPCVREALLDSPWGPFPFTCVNQLLYLLIELQVWIVGFHILLGFLTIIMNLVLSI